LKRSATGLVEDALNDTINDTILFLVYSSDGQHVSDPLFGLYTTTGSVYMDSMIVLRHVQRVCRTSLDRAPNSRE
jgi:hypothetical protein